MRKALISALTVNVLIITTHFAASATKKDCGRALNPLDHSTRSSADQFMDRSQVQPIRRGTRIVDQNNLSLDQIKENIANLATRVLQIDLRIKNIEKIELPAKNVLLSEKNKKARRKHDPRLFAQWGLRKDKTNPYTGKLKEEKLRLELQLQALHPLKESIEKLDALRGNPNFFDSDIEIQVLDWLINRIQGIHDQIMAGDGIDGAELETTLADIAAFTKSNGNEKPGEEFDQLIKKYRAALFRELNHVSRAEKVLGREVSTPVVDRLLLFSSNFKMKFEDVIQEFKEFDDLIFKKKRRRAENLGCKTIMSSLFSDFICRRKFPLQRLLIDLTKWTD